MWQLDVAALKAAIRTPFKATTEAGLLRILAHPLAQEFTRAQLAYVLASVWHETAVWCHPIREGAVRYGPSYSDASAQAAVATLYARGLITKNYALCDPRTNQSYYGRGLIQITHLDNYFKFEKLLKADLVKNPDLALDWDVALDILFYGFKHGMWTGKSIASVVSEKDWYEARAIVNGDKRKNGNKIAEYAQMFYSAFSKKD